MLNAIFNLLNATSMNQRLAALNRFIDWWYGPINLRLGAAVSDPRLPLPLRLFFEQNENRPSRIDSPFRFYEGEGGHHLWAPLEIEYFDDDKLRFFSEYQGDWQAVTQTGSDDPSVWLEMSRAFFRRKKLKQTLSEFLTTHILLTSIYEHFNSALQGWAEHHPSLKEMFGRADVSKTLVWESSDIPKYAGKVFLLDDAILVHESQAGDIAFATNDPSYASEFRST